MSARYRSFAEARKYVRSLKLKSVAHHLSWCTGMEKNLQPKPSDIPATPHQVYRTEWISFSDYLGTNRTATFRRKFRPFDEAREFAHALCLGSVEEWSEYACGRLHVPGMSPRPENIPSNPNFTYKETGWAGFADWLGYGDPSIPQASQFRPFAEARDFARSLNLSGWVEWREYVSKAAKPLDIPAIPHSAYRGRGWLDYGDWLGTGLNAYHQSPFLSFEAAHDFIGMIGLKNQKDWRDYCSGKLAHLGTKPTNIPTNPDKAYTAEWKGWGYWFDVS